jgi:hypothetical protein
VVLNNYTVGAVIWCCQRCKQANRAAAEHRREVKAAAKLARRWAGKGAELEQQAQDAHSTAAAAAQSAARAEAERDASRLRVLALERQVRCCAVTSTCEGLCVACAAVFHCLWLV